MRALLEPNIAAKLDRLTKLEWALERAITLPILGKKAGVDAILGLIPGGGDLIAGALGSYIIVEAVHARAPKRLIARMMWNLGFDTTIGAIPIAGDIFDFFYSSNTKNLKLLKAHLEKQVAKTPQPPTGVTRITSLSGAPGRAHAA
jgi:Domain of unknown function (DUF4112)